MRPSGSPMGDCKQTFRSVVLMGKEGAVSTMVGVTTARDRCSSVTPRVVTMIQ